MKLSDYHSVYFLGIGGIGMSALARWFNHNGFNVAGYDRTATPLTMQLEEEGVEVHYNDSVDAIPEYIKQSASEALIIYTPAIPKKHQEYNFLKDTGYTILKRSQVLGLLSERFFTIAVAGTHGKTTTSSMVAHLLKHANRDITAFLGGIASNYNSNFIANETDEAVAVVEADEFDRSFLTLSPNIAVVTASDADHLDIYGDKNALKDSFKEFIGKIRNDGQLFINDKISDELLENHSYQGSRNTYGIERGEYYASNIIVRNGIFEFDYCDSKLTIAGLKLYVPGFHNVENATAAIASALAVGVSASDVKQGIESYRGVKRRFEYLINKENIVFVDDYAHHPVEIEAFLKSLQALFPNRKVTAIFQPHLFSRTRDFAAEFAQSLSLADEVILLDIYPAREEPLEGVSSEMIFKDITIDNKVLCNKESLMELVRERELDVVATIGAGDIDQLVKPLKQYLEGRYEA